MEIVVDDLSGEEIAIFLEEHIDDMRATSPPESVHALDLEGLKSSSVTFWSVRKKGEIVGCGAIVELDAYHGEIKSMRTKASSRGAGVASHLLAHILKTAKARAYHRVSLETGSMDFFDPARRLYKNHGFTLCPPFSQYREDPNSVFMTREI